MIELNDNEKKIVEVMRTLRAVAEDKMKDADQIAKTAMLPKGVASNILINLANKKVVRRIAREKAAGYYLIESMLQ